MKKYQKGLVIGGVVLAALTPAALVAADSWNGGNGGGRGNGSMDCDGSGRMQGQNGQGQNGQGQNGQGQHGQGQHGQGQHGQGGGAGQQLRDGSGPNHTAGDTVRPMDGTGTQQRGGR